MSLGTFGTKRLASTSPVDMDVYIIYSPDRNADSDISISFKRGNEVISPITHTSDTQGSSNEALGGMYNLNLNSNIFSEKGIYTIHVRPAEIRTTIEDCSALAAFPSTKGLVFDTNNVPSDFEESFSNNGLDGYRIEYLDSNNQKIPDLYKIITSSFFAEPINVNNTNSSQKSIRYSYNDAASLLFCTVAPNTPPSNRPDFEPFIGRQGQNVIISNTNFNPTTFEVEMVEHDLESLSYALYGEQSKSIDDGIYTIYDDRGNIYAQYNLFEIRSGTGQPLYEVRTRRNNIDDDKSLDNITNQGS
jgi:hypothetical protein